jgi:hypothetical protein
MSNKIIPDKYVLLTATVLSAVMLAVSPMASLVPTTAYAQEEEEEEVSEGDEEAQLNVDYKDQEDNSEIEGGDNSVVVDPKVQTSVQPAVNVDVNTHVITDEEDCDEASDEVNQGNIQFANQEARSDGKVGEGSFYVSPVVQLSTQVALNVYVDTDVILVPGCNPSDEVNQGNVASANQEADSDVEADEGNAITPSYQRADVIQRNDNVQNEVIIPVLPAE